MSLIVEDGTGLANAESYASTSYADAYHDAIGNAAWSGSVLASAKESALRRAAQYIGANYRFRGEPLNDTQALAFPRDSALWPVKRLQDAACELALRALAGPLFADQVGGDVIGESVGPISATYSPTGLAGQTRYAAVDALLSTLTAGSSRMSMRIERAS